MIPAHKRLKRQPIESRAIIRPLIAFHLLRTWMPLPSLLANKLHCYTRARYIPYHSIITTSNEPSICPCRFKIRLDTCGSPTSGLG